MSVDGGMLKQHYKVQLLWAHMFFIFCNSAVPWIGAAKVPRTFPAVPAASDATPGMTSSERKIAIREITIQHMGEQRDLARDTILMRWLEAARTVPSWKAVNRERRSAGTGPANSS